MTMQSHTTIGAVIVAAGMSSRMGDFKPMLNIGAISIAQRIVATLRQAGAQHIVVVTGFNADALERHLSGKGLVFLRNSNYETTDMFTSAKIGLAYLQNKCDAMLFTPVDIPLFTCDTVRTLINTQCDIAIPVCEQSEGHPILIASHLVPALVNWSGEGGLRDAIKALNANICHVPVRDAGILHDADTPQDYQALLDYHNRQLARTEIKVTLSRELPFFDEKNSHAIGTHQRNRLCQHRLQAHANFLFHRLEQNSPPGITNQIRSIDPCAGRRRWRRQSPHSRRASTFKSLLPVCRRY